MFAPDPPRKVLPAGAGSTYTHPDPTRPHMYTSHLLSKVLRMHFALPRHFSTTFVKICFPLWWEAQFWRSTQSTFDRRKHFFAVLGAPIGCILGMLFAPFALVFVPFAFCRRGPGPVHSCWATLGGGGRKAFPCVTYGGSVCHRPRRSAHGVLMAAGSEKPPMSCH